MLRPASARGEAASTILLPRRQRHGQGAVVARKDVDGRRPGAVEAGVERAVGVVACDGEALLRRRSRTGDDDLPVPWITTSWHGPGADAVEHRAAVSKGGGPPFGEVADDAKPSSSKSLGRATSRRRRSSRPPDGDARGPPPSQRRVEVGDAAGRTSGPGRPPRTTGGLHLFDRRDCAPARPRARRRTGRARDGRRGARHGEAKQLGNSASSCRFLFAMRRGAGCARRVGRNVPAEPLRRGPPRVAPARRHMVQSA